MAQLKQTLAQSLLDKDIQLLEFSKGFYIVKNRNPFFVNSSSFLDFSGSLAWFDSFKKKKLLFYELYSTFSYNDARLYA